MLCKYRHIFGQERKGVHALRVLDIAVVDVLGTVLLGMLLSWWTGWYLIVCIAVWFMAAIILHQVFCVDTTVNRWLSKECCLHIQVEQ